MKRKIALLITMVGILVCLLAISVNAQVITFDSYEEKINLTYDQTELVVFDDGCTYPSYYIFIDSTAFETDYNWLNGKTGKSYSDSNVVELCVPNGVTTGGYFKKDSLFKNLLKLNTGKTLTKTNGDFYQNQTLTHVTFGQGYTNDGLGTWFFNGAKVEYIIFDDNSAITTLPGQFLANLNSLKGLYLGRSITNIGSGTFSNMGSSNVFLMNTPNDTEAPEVYYFKSTLVEGNFYNFKTNATTKVWVFPSTANGIGSGWNIDNSSNIPGKFVFLTSDANGVVVNDTIGSNKLSSTNIYFPNISSENATSMSLTPKTTYYFGVDAKKASYNGSWGEFTDMVDGDHLHDTANDKIIDVTCSKNGMSYTYCFCGKEMETKVTADALGHTHADGVAYVSINYNGNYLANGYYVYVCDRCQENYDDATADAPALFVIRGYSNATGAIMQSFQVNKEAIANYNKYATTPIKYGILAANGALQTLNIGTSFVNGVISVDFTNRSYDIMEMKIYGITSATQDTALYCCGYVEVDGGIVYMDYGMASDATLPTTVTYTGLGGTFVEATSLDAVVPAKEDEVA